VVARATLYDPARLSVTKETVMTDPTTTPQERKSTMTTIDNLTIGEAKAIAAMFAATVTPTPNLSSAPMPVLVCTDKRAVVFGYCGNVEARPIILTKARMCLYWSADVGGVFGLAEVGPTSGCKISAPVSKVSLEGVTAVFAVEADAVKAWNDAPVQGRK
jgi:hypothetical protein